MTKQILVGIDVFFFDNFGYVVKIYDDLYLTTFVLFCVRNEDDFSKIHRV
jgi:hypothetical protein